MIQSIILRYTQKIFLVLFIMSFSLIFTACNSFNDVTNPKTATNSDISSSIDNFLEKTSATSNFVSIFSPGKSSLLIKGVKVTISGNIYNSSGKAVTNITVGLDDGLALMCVPKAFTTK